REGLEKAPSSVDKTALEKRVKEINDENLVEDEYTPDSWKTLQDALEAAQRVLEDEGATVEDISKALANLNSARNGLTKRDASGGNGGNTGGNNGNSGGGSTWYPSTPAPAPTPTPTPEKPIIDVTKNGSQDSFATGTEQKAENGTKTNILIDKNKLSDILSQGKGQQLSVHVPNKGNVEATGLTAADVQKLANTGSSLQISNLLAIYPVPGGQLNLNAIANNWNNAALSDIAVQIDIQLAPDGVIDRARKQASSKGYELLVDPVDLDLTFKHDGKTIRSGLLNGYAPKYIALPEGIDPNRITTGVVVNPDGTVFHVPTVVTKIGDRYFAQINDLRSSGTYSVIWNPKDFDDVRNHWAQSKVNNISARLDLEGTGSNTWSPDRNVDRAQFAAIVSYGMGIMRQDLQQNIFNDVNTSAWYYPSISIANEFGIVKGYGDDTFRGNQLITREEGIAMIARAYKLVRPEATIHQSDADHLLAGYGDVNQVSAWAKESVALMISAGIVEGKEGKLLKPQDYMTRAESVALMERLLKVTDLIDK
ncbi:S-layer homology domain-containing protein, partial [Paenibacillus motobuensis]